jgi:hypothetical protein
LDTFQFSSVCRPKRFLYFDSLSLLRGSNNKHLLLKCINCNKNKNNNKLKQLPSRKDGEGRRKKSVVEKNSEETNKKINYLRNI